MPLSYEPAPQLRPFVRRLYGFRAATGAPRRLREGPGPDVVVVLTFGPAWRIGDVMAPTARPARHTSFAAGLRLTSVVTEHDGLAHGMQASLTPPGAFAVFRRPMHELAHGVVPLDDLLGADADRLVERLAGEPSWPERFALLEAVLAARLVDAPPPAPGVLWAWRRLSETRGGVRVEALARELGWSRRRLLDRFREQVGVGPKSLARLLRFERAVELLTSPEPPALAAVAATCGYYDQAHMAGEFRRITASTPARYAASAQLPFLQDGGGRGS